MQKIKDVRRIEMSIIRDLQIDENGLFVDG